MFEYIHLGKPFSFLENGSMTLKSPDKKLLWSFQASNLLCELGGKHMLQPPPQNLHYAIETGHAIVATNPYDTLSGFVKMSPWMVNTEDLDKEEKKGFMAEQETDFEKIHNGSAVPVCVEIGSLVVDTSKQGNNLGKALVNHMVTMSDSAYPNIPKIAVVTNDNIASLHVFNRLGWEIVSREDAKKILNIDVLDGWDPPSTIFMYKGVQEIIN